jgi:anti-anti-sigma regulatory factor
VLQRLLELPAAAALPASSMEALIASQIQRIRRGHALESWDPEGRTIQVLCGCTAAQRLQPQAVQRLAAAALQQMLHFVAGALLTCLPAAQQLDRAVVQQLLEALVGSHEVPHYDELNENPPPMHWQRQTYGLLQVLLHLPGAGQLQPHKVAERVLLPALQLRALDLLSRLCSKVQLDVPSLENLLHAALQLRDFEATAALMDVAAAQQLSASSIQSCLEAVLGRKGGGRVQMLRTLSHPDWIIKERKDVAQKLLTLPAAQQLPAAAVAALLEAAVELLLEPVVQKLFALPAAREVEPSQLLKLMQRAMQLRMDKVVNTLANTLARQPAAAAAAAQINAEQVAGVLADAMRLRLSEVALLPLVDLLAGFKPPVSRATYMSLLQLAEKQQCVDSIQLLLQMQHAEKIQPGMLLQLMAGAVHELSFGALDALRELPAAAKLTAAAILPLLKAAAVQADSGEVVRILACLPTAGDMSGEAAQAVVAAALQHRLADNAEGICEWLHSVEHISAAGVAELLHASLVVNEMGIVHELCATLGANLIDADELLQLLQHAIRLRHIRAVNALLELPGAEGLTAAAAKVLLLQCVQSRWQVTGDRWLNPAKEAQATVSRLTAVCKLDAAALLRLLQAAVAHRDALFLPQLVQQQPAAGKIAVADVAALLEAAVKRGDGQLAKHLCQLAGAKALEPDALQPLLRTALSFKLDSQFYNPHWQLYDTSLCDSQSDAAVVLLQLPGARRLSVACVQALLQVTAAFSHGEHPHSGMRSPAAAALAELLPQSRP